MGDKIKIFEDKKVRAKWDEEKEEWYWSIVDAVEVLTESVDPSAYWRKLKERLKSEGNETVTNCHGLKMLAKDGKMRMTDVASTEELLRIIQSIPSPKAEPFKMWLAEVGNDRLNEIADPELAIDRALETYLRKGYSEKWINQRLKTIEVRKEYTDELKARGVTAQKDFAILTNEMTRAWSGKTTKEYKVFKGLKKESLRDNMTNVELILNMLAEATATDLTKEKNPQRFEEHKNVALEGGGVAKSARVQYEKAMGKPAISPLNAKNIKELKNKNEE
jgi:hypothetical protein